MFTQNGKTFVVMLIISNFKHYIDLNIMVSQSSYNEFYETYTWIKENIDDWIPETRTKIKKDNLCIILVKYFKNK